MVNYLPERLDRVFSALSDPTRRAILDQLTHGGATVTELADPFDMSLPAISKHLRVLEQAGLITRERSGRIHHLHLAPAAMKEAVEWLNHYRQFWDNQFDTLVAYLDIPPDKPTSS